MPLNNNKEKIVEGSETDLYTYGSVGLKSDAIILCPENEVEQIKKENPNSTVVGYQGETVTPYVDVFVSQVLGYKYKKPTEKARNWDHGNGEDHETAERIIKENGWKYTDHYYSDYMKQENLEEQIDNFIAIIQIIMKDNLLFDEENMKSIIKKFNEDLGNNGYFYNIPNKLEYISKRIEEKTKIKMLDGSNDSPKLISAEELTNILRYVALTKKYEQGLLTESEKNTFLKNLDISKIRDEDIDYFIRQIDEKIEKVGIGGVLIPKLHRNDKGINMNLMIEDKNYLDAMIPLINFINAAAKSRVSVSYDSLKPKEKMLHLIEVAKEYSDTHIRGIDENDEIITDFNIMGCKNIIEIEQKVFDLIETMEKNENYICPEDIAEFGLDIEDETPNTNIKKATK